MHYSRHASMTPHSFVRLLAALLCLGAVSLGAMGGAHPQEGVVKGVVCVLYVRVVILLGRKRDLYALLADSVSSYEACLSVFFFMEEEACFLRVEWSLLLGRAWQLPRRHGSCDQRDWLSGDLDFALVPWAVEDAGFWGGVSSVDIVRQI